jgi:hypothetical protein
MTDWSKKVIFVNAQFQNKEDILESKQFFEEWNVNIWKTTTTTQLYSILEYCRFHQLYFICM